MSRHAAPEPLVELCAFQIGDEHYVVDVRRIREILPPQRLTPLPRGADFVEGVMQVRREIIPVIDARKRFGIDPRPFTRKTKFLVVTVAGRVLGLVVDAVTEVLRVPRASIHPALGLARLEGTRLFLGVCEGHPGGRGSGRRRTWLLLNVKALLEPIEPADVVAARELAREPERA